MCEFPNTGRYSSVANDLCLYGTGYGSRTLDLETTAIVHALLCSLLLDLGSWINYE